MSMDASEGFSQLTEDYIGEYAEEVLLNRAIPDLRDGLKPVHRRILFQMHKGNYKEFTKSSDPVGQTMAFFHPHGDAAIYDALTRMTDRNGSFLVPTVVGGGNMGRFYSSDDPADARYTEVKNSKILEDFMRDAEGMSWKRAEIDAGSKESYEPEALPVNFPYVLTSGAMGVAVGFSTRIPSFNFWDVLDITEKMIKQGTLTRDDVIVPDFPTGGNLVYNQKELYKMLVTGTGRVKVRADVELDGKNIIVKELPVGQKLEKLVKKISEAEIRGVREVANDSDFYNPVRIRITCTSAANAESVLMTLYQRGLLQTSFTSQIITTLGKKPILTGGVQGVLKEWLKWRKQVLDKKYSARINKLKDTQRVLNYFIALVQKEEWRDKYVDLILQKGGVAPANEFLQEIFPEISDEDCNWISQRRITSFQNGGKYVAQRDSLQEQINYAAWVLSKPHEKILKDLDDLRSRFAGQFERKTKIVYEDYRFSKVSSSVVEDTSSVFFTFFKDGLVLKSRNQYAGNRRSFVLKEVIAPANETFMAINQDANLIRVFGSELPLENSTAMGTDLGAYSGADSVDTLAVFLLEEKTKMLVYTDGWVGFLDLREFMGQTRGRKLIRNGVSPMVKDRLAKIYDESEFGFGVAGAIVGEKNIWLSWKPLARIARKSRTTRTRVFTPPAGQEFVPEFLMLEGPYDVAKLLPNEDAEWFSDAMRKVPFTHPGIAAMGEKFVTLV